MAFDVGTIDGIARRLGRDVLFLALLDEEDESLDIYAEVDPITDWLEAAGIRSKICTAFSEDIVFIVGGPGCIYIEVDPKAKSEQFAVLVDRFGPIDGPPSQPGFKLAVLTLEDAMKNAAQDDPAFWDDLV